MTDTQKIARILVESAIEEMARISGASHAEIWNAILADPAGNAAQRFRDYMTLGLKAAA